MDLIEATVTTLISRIQSGEFTAVILTPCSRSFSPTLNLLGTCTRTKRAPWGSTFGPRHRDERAGNRMWIVAVRIARVCAQARVGYLMMHPKSSLAWRTPIWRRTFVSSLQPCFEGRIDWCRFGRPWRHTTLIRGSCPVTHELSRSCNCSGPHTRSSRLVTDEHGKTRNVQKLLQSYPISFWFELLKLLREHLVARCVAGYNHRGERVGEASNPGPGRGVPTSERATGQIDITEGITEVTRIKYAQQLGRYDQWAQRYSLPLSGALSSMPTDVINACLKAYMQHLAATRRPPSDGAMLCAGFLHAHQHHRGRIGESWKALNVWRATTPRHIRVGVDENFLLAMVTLAKSWNWDRVAVSLLLGFYGLLRPGEILGLRRAHLGLPSDASGLTEFSVTVAIVRPKTRYRAARMQAVVIRERVVVEACESILRSLLPREFVLPMESRVFTMYFDHLVRALSCPPLPYSPGSLRGGGALAFLRCHRGDLTALLFQGRWDSVKTLSHYIFKRGLQPSL